MADVLAVRNELRMRNWMEIIRECQESGLTNKEFCAQRGISEKTFYYWLRKIRGAAVTAMEPHLVRLEEPPNRDSERMIHIRYGKTELTLPDDVDLKAAASGARFLPCFPAFSCTYYTINQPVLLENTEFF